MTKKRAQGGGGGHQHVCDNYIGGQFLPPVKGQYLDVVSPLDDAVISQVAVSTFDDVAFAVERASAAFPEWSGLTMKSRAAIMFRLHHLLEAHADELAELVVRENGKNKTEALASVAKGNETVEWACSLPQIAQGKILQVSRGITCYDHREPLGVVASIVPFNFPIMVPMWTIPIALTTGNCVILKPSEKVPMTMNRVAELMAEAGVPPGVFQIVNGTVEAVNCLIEHRDVKAVSFVGSSRVAEIVAQKGRALNKRVLALGGAKNHLVALPDCDTNMAAQDIVASFAGCSGQRCMAASVLVPVGDTGDLLEKVVAKTEALKPGVGAGEVGPVIDAAAQQRVLKYINEAEAGGATILVDGRKWADKKPGTWVGPTIILHTNQADAALQDEIFGPVLSIIMVDTWDEALQIENRSPFGNAACVYTTVGAHAEYFQSRFRSAMIGINIGIPVPREPFSFGGLYGTLSKFGDMDITGEGCLEFFTNRRKITSKWAYPTAPITAATQAAGGQRASQASGDNGGVTQMDVTDKANFNGVM